VPTDAATYLRLLGERLILDRDQHAQHRPGGGPLGQAAQTLLAAGALAPDIAEQIVQDYAWAQRLRDPNSRHMPPQHALRRAPGHRADPSGTSHAAPAPAVQPLSAPRVAVCDRSVEQPWGRIRIRCVSLESGSVVIGVVIRWPSGMSGRRRASALSGQPSPLGRPGMLTVTDDRGNSVQAGFSGGGGEDEWTGEFRSHDSPRGSLADDTAYVEVLGERIQLPPAATAPCATVRLEAVERGDRAVHALWGGLAGSLVRHGISDPDIAIDALVECGVLAPDDPAIGQVRAVTTALGMPHLGHGRLRSGPVPAQPPVPATVPEPWAALLARRNRPPPVGPTGLLPVAVATPVFDDMSVAVSVLTSDADGFRISIVMVGLPHALMGWDAEAFRVAWWARDDRGGAYLGDWRGHSSDGHRLTGDIGFDQPLDPDATRLDLMPTGPTTRAVIEVPLSWPSDPADGDSSGSRGG
jgi:hypothetical protein